MKRFLIGFAVVALVIAGALSYLADPDPDGLDSVTQRGCTAAESGEQAGELSGECIAQGAREHALAGGPLADYTIGGDDGLTGVAGVLGVAATLVVAGGVFWLLRRRKPTS
jgi:cobalt/nickel transport protein